MSGRKIFLSVRTLKMMVFMLIDIAIIFVSYLLGYLVEFNNVSLTSVLFISMMALIHIIVLFIFNGYRIITDNFSLTDAIRIAILILLINIGAALANQFIPSLDNLSIWMFAFIAALQGVLVVGSRCVQRITKFYFTNGKNAVSTMIIGAGSAGKIAFDEMHNNVEFQNKVVCFGDSDVDKIGKRYLGKPIVGPLNNIPQYIQKYGIKEVVIAISSLSKKDLNEIIEALSNENVTIKRMPLLTELTDPTKPLAIKEVSIAELLGRDQITFDSSKIQNWLEGKTVLITGGGGSIGSELARQCESFKVKRLVLFDIYENAVYDIQQELVRKLRNNNSSMELITLIGSTYNEFRVEEIFRKYNIDIVFHAAAYKHVPLMEDSPAEAIRTNCLGTYIVVKMCDKYKVKKMVLVSTDKAVRPTNTMGATKAFAEMVIRYFAEKSENTAYSAVRFGNVLGSNGSVIPLFKKQIAEGGPVTVTHKDIIRYFMTIPEAVSLILESGAFAKGGEIFILDMGEPVRIVTLAEKLIKQCGYTPYKDIEIIFTGLRPGEKLYEELLLDVTNHEKTDNSKIFIERKKKVLPMEEKIEFISQVFEMTDTEQIKDVLRQVVTSYTNYLEFNEQNCSKEMVGVK